MPHTGDDERLDLIYVPHARINKHDRPVISAQNEKEKVCHHPLTPT